MCRNHEDLRKNILSNRLPKGVLFEKSKAHGFHRSIKGSLTETALPKRLLQGQFFCIYSKMVCSTSGLIFTPGLPKRTPHACAASIPSRCRCLMFSLSFSAAKDRTCSTRSAMKVPNKSLLRVVSKSGISISFAFRLIHSYYLRFTHSIGKIEVIISNLQNDVRFHSHNTLFL